jgi:hypothetical protein
MGKEGDTMSFKVAITTSNGKLINQHFGHCSEFTIVEVDENTGNWEFAEKRNVEQTCQEFFHDEDHIDEVAKMLSDCLYLLTYRIGGIIFHPRSWCTICPMGYTSGNIRNGLKKLTDRKTVVS